MNIEINSAPYVNPVATTLHALPKTAEGVSSTHHKFLATGYDRQISNGKMRLYASMHQREFVAFLRF